MRLSAIAAALAASLAFLPAAFGANADAPPETTWETIRYDIFETDTFENGEAVMALEAPYRAEDAAIVPFAVNVKPGSGIKSVTIVIDENPAPMAAKFTFGPGAASPSFESRFRVNNYSWVRAIGETDDGRKFMVKKYVKASGGCSAPAGKDMDVAEKEMGKSKLRMLDAAADDQLKAPNNGSQAQIMLRHPNYSGLQMDQVTMLFIPARFIDKLEVKRGDDMVMTVEGGISLSEDPNVRFFYRTDGQGDFTMDATDTAGAHFEATWPAQPGT